MPGQDQERTAEGQELSPDERAAKAAQEREHALASFKAKLIESREWEAKLKNLRLELKSLNKEYEQTEENIKALQSVGQIIGEVLKQLDDERCACSRLLPRAPNDGGC
jgi:ATP-dependent 26S proteasome regulatory subunit